MVTLMAAAAETEEVTYFHEVFFSGCTFEDLLGWVSSEGLSIFLILWVGFWIYKILIDMGNEV